MLLGRWVVIGEWVEGGGGLGHMFYGGGGGGMGSAGWRWGGAGSGGGVVVVVGQGDDGRWVWYGSHVTWEVGSDG